jgi:copper homeostasis protein
MAFDELQDPKAGIDTLVELGITRILTKGGKTPAMNNLEQLKALNEYAKGRIQLIVGGSVAEENYKAIANATKIQRYHGRKLAITL